MDRAKTQYVYLAGAMRNNPGFREQFKHARDDLRAQGYSVFCPAEYDEVIGRSDDLPLRDYMKDDLNALLTSDLVAVLPGWRDSEGASLEVHVAHKCDIPVWQLDVKKHWNPHTARWTEVVYDFVYQINPDNSLTYGNAPNWEPMDTDKDYGVFEHDSPYNRDYGDESDWQFTESSFESEALERGYAIGDTNLISYESGAVRSNNTGKVDYRYAMDGPMFERYAAHLQKHAEEKGARNWLLGCTDEDVDRGEASAQRHMYQWLRGKTDEDHAAAIIFNIDYAENAKMNRDK